MRRAVGMTTFSTPLDTVIGILNHMASKEVEFRLFFLADVKPFESLLDAMLIVSARTTITSVVNVE